MDLRERLKTETHGEHLRTEDVLRDLTSSSLTRERYREILLGFAAFYSELKVFMSGQASSPATLYYDSLRGKSLARLESDLAFLGEALPVRGFDLTAIGARFPSEASLWGVLYVVEGSALGGQLIVKKLSESLQLSANAGASFFAGEGAETGLHWRQFLARLENPATAKDPDATVAGAREGFRWVARSFET